MQFEEIPGPAADTDRESGISLPSTRIVSMMSGEEEDLRSPDTPVIPVTTTQYQSPRMMPVTTLHTMTLSLPIYCPLNLGYQGAEGRVPGWCWDALGAFEWSMFDTITQESWLLTPAPSWESQYKPPHETGACPKHRREKAGWEEHLTRMESAQDRLIQVVAEALMGIPGTIAQVMQVESHLQLQQQMPQQPPSPPQPQDQHVPVPPSGRTCSGTEIARDPSKGVARHEV
ncbi:UNVERIFIED_CONTAM: hypothetical protein K2H54_061630 [Gekko kuhli]